MAKLSILKRNGDSTATYSTYAAARLASVSGDVIQIWADLLTEQIVLKDKVDIWIMPGVVIDNTSGGATITDNNDSVNCNIYGFGKIYNSNTNSPFYECIKISNGNTQLTVECDHIESLGGLNVQFLQAPCIYIINGKKFHLKCNTVYNCRNTGLWIGSTTNIIPDVNLNIKKIETGSIDPNNNTYYGSTALITHGIGFIKVNEILCSNAGHCISHRAGTITAIIKKMKTVNNISGLSISTVHLDQGNNSQKLILYFDEILNLAGLSSSFAGIELKQGTGIFIGREVYAKDGNAIDISGDSVKGSVTCNDVISEFASGVRIDLVNNQFIINANFITGYSLYGCIYAQSDANLLIKNAKLINTDTSSNSRCFVLEQVSNQIPNITIKNIKSVTGNISGGSIFYKQIFQESTVSIMAHLQIKDLMQI